MNNIIHHIETLIRRHDYVIIPELGGFVFRKQPAVITPGQQTPPLTIISFNPLMNVSDGLLAIEISRSEEISFREAMESIHQFAGSVSSQLDSGKTVQLGKIGQLYRDEEKKIIFRKAETDHFIPANFGLKELHFAAIAREESVDQERRVIRIVMPRAQTVAKYAAVAVLAAGLFFMAPKLSETYHNVSTLNPFSRLNTTEVISDAGSANSRDELTITPQENIVTELPAPKIVTAVKELNHHVIVSAMATAEDAEAYCNRLIQLDYRDAHVLEPIRTYRIAIASFETKAEAVAYMQTLRAEKPQFSDAWVLSE